MEITRPGVMSLDVTRWPRVMWRYCAGILRLGLRIMFNPMDGFYDLKFEGRWGAVPLLLLAALLVRMGGLMWSSYHFSELDPEDTSFLLEFVRIMAPWITWCIAAYGVSSISYGEGTFKQIIIASAYCLMPYVLLNLPVVLIFTHILSLNEKSLFSFLTTCIQLWVAVLFFCQTWVLHNFSFRKAISISTLTLIGILVSWVLLALVFVLTNQMVQFFAQVIYEFTTRS